MQRHKVDYQSVDRREGFVPRIRPGPRKGRVDDKDDSSPGVWEGRLRLWIVIDGRNAIGPGKVRLLEAVAATKSLSEAAKQLRMSYRLAWKHLRAIEKHTKLAVVHPRRGGADGGGTDLTPEGQALLEAYRKCWREVEGQVREACRRHFAPWSAREADRT